MVFGRHSRVDILRREGLAKLAARRQLLIALRESLPDRSQHLRKPKRNLLRLGMIAVLMLVRLNRAITAKRLAQQHAAIEATTPMTRKRKLPPRHLRADSPLSGEQPPETPPVTTLEQREHAEKEKEGKATQPTPIDSTTAAAGASGPSERAAGTGEGTTGGTTTGQPSVSTAQRARQIQQRIKNRQERRQKRKVDPDLVFIQGSDVESDDLDEDDDEPPILPPAASGPTITAQQQQQQAPVGGVGGEMVSEAPAGKGFFPSAKDLSEYPGAIVDAVYGSAVGSLRRCVDMLRLKRVLRFRHSKRITPDISAIPSSIWERSLIFKGWPLASLAEFVSRGHIEKCGVGEPLFYYKEPTTHVRILLDGSVAVLRPKKHTHPAAEGRGHHHHHHKAHLSSSKKLCTANGRIVAQYDCPIAIRETVSLIEEDVIDAVEATSSSEVLLVPIEAVKDVFETLPPQVRAQVSQRCVERRQQLAAQRGINMAHLVKVPLFAFATPAQLDKIASIMVPKCYLEGTDLITTEDFNDKFEAHSAFLVSRGSLLGYTKARNPADGSWEDAKFARWTVGMSLGEKALYFKERFLFNIKAETHTDVWALHRAPLMQLLVAERALKQCIADGAFSVRCRDPSVRMMLFSVRNIPCIRQGVKEGILNETQVREIYKLFEFKIFPGSELITSASMAITEMYVLMIGVATTDVSGNVPFPTPKNVVIGAAAVVPMRWRYASLAVTSCEGWALPVTRLAAYFDKLGILPRMKELASQLHDHDMNSDQSKYVMEVKIPPKPTGTTAVNPRIVGKRRKVMRGYEYLLVTPNEALRSMQAEISSVNAKKTMAQVEAAVEEEDEEFSDDDSSSGGIPRRISVASSSVSTGSAAAAAPGGGPAAARLASRRQSLVTRRQSTVMGGMNRGRSSMQSSTTTAQSGSQVHQHQVSTGGESRLGGTAEAPRKGSLISFVRSSESTATATSTDRSRHTRTRRGTDGGAGGTMTWSGESHPVFLESREAPTFAPLLFPGKLEESRLFERNGSPSPTFCDSRNAVCALGPEKEEKSAPQLHLLEHPQGGGEEEHSVEMESILPGVIDPSWVPQDRMERFAVRRLEELRAENAKLERKVNKRREDTFYLTLAPPRPTTAPLVPINAPSPLKEIGSLRKRQYGHCDGEPPPPNAPSALLAVDETLPHHDQHQEGSGAGVRPASVASRGTNDRPRTSASAVGRRRVKLPTRSSRCRPGTGSSLKSFEEILSSTQPNKTGSTTTGSTGTGTDSGTKTGGQPEFPAVV